MILLCEIVLINIMIVFQKDRGDEEDDTMREFNDEDDITCKNVVTNMSSFWKSVATYTSSWINMVTKMGVILK